MILIFSKPKKDYLIGSMNFTSLMRLILSKLKYYPNLEGHNHYA